MLMALLLFDIDGTILDMRHLIHRVLRRYDQEHGADHDQEVDRDPVQLEGARAEAGGRLAGGDRAKGIVIRYSQGGESADDLIRRMARKEKTKALVVSSDREVMAAAESAGATVMDSPSFEEKVAMASYLALKGAGETIESRGWVPTTRKKGPSRRPPKRQRRNRRKLRKL